MQITSAVFAALSGIAEGASARSLDQTVGPNTGFEFADLLSGLEEQTEMAETTAEEGQQDLTALGVFVPPSVVTGTRVTLLHFSGFSLAGHDNAVNSSASENPTAQPEMEARPELIPVDGTGSPVPAHVTEGDAPISEKRESTEASSMPSLIVASLPAVPQPVAAVAPQPEAIARVADRSAPEKAAVSPALENKPGSNAPATVQEPLPPSTPVLPHSSFAGTLRKTSEANSDARITSSRAATATPPATHIAAPAAAVENSTDGLTATHGTARFVPPMEHAAGLQSENQPDADIQTPTAKEQADIARIHWTAPSNASGSQHPPDSVRSADVPSANSRPAEPVLPAEDARAQSTVQSLNVRVGDGDERADLRFVHRNGNVEMSVRTASPEVAKQLSAQLAELKQNLASSGWNADLQPATEAAGRNNNATAALIHETIGSAQSHHSGTIGLSAEARTAESIKSGASTNPDGDSSGSSNENDRHGRRHDYLADENRQGRRGRRDWEINEDD